MTRRTILWTAAALLGIAVTAAVAWAASQLAGQRIGLASAPLSVQRGLAPPGTRSRRSAAASRHQRRAHGRVETTGRGTKSPRSVVHTITVTTASPPAPPTSIAPRSVASSPPPAQSVTGTSPPRGHSGGGHDDGGGGPSGGQDD